MTTPSGTISLNDVNVELGLAGTTTISMNQTNVRTLAGVPSGAISMQNLQGKSNRITANISISTNTANYTLGTSKVTGYIAGKTDVTLTIDSGVYVYSASTGSYAMTVDTSWTTGDTITIVNNGTIIGRGGDGGTGGTGGIDNAVAGSPAGPALLVQRAASINNVNRIAGGGGGGGGRRLWMVPANPFFSSSEYFSVSTMSLSACSPESSTSRNRVAPASCPHWMKEKNNSKSLPTAFAVSSSWCRTASGSFGSPSWMTSTVVGRPSRTYDCRCASTTAVSTGRRFVVPPGLCRLNTRSTSAAVLHPGTISYWLPKTYIVDPSGSAAHTAGTMSRSACSASCHRLCVPTSLMVMEPLLSRMMT